MNITPNKHKLYEKNLDFGFYLGREEKNYIIKLYNIFLKNLKIYKI